MNFKEVKRTPRPDDKTPLYYEVEMRDGYVTVLLGVLPGENPKPEDLNEQAEKIHNIRRLELFEAFDAKLKETFPPVAMNSWPGPPKGYMSREWKR